MNQRSIRVVVIDDHSVVREGVTALLRREPDIEVVGAAASGEDGLELLSEVAADVVLIDYRLPGMSGATTCRALLRQQPGAVVVMLSSFVTEEVILASLAAGARGYVIKDVLAADLPEVVRSAAAGESVLAPPAAKALVNSIQRGALGPPRGALDPRRDGSLTPIEVEILAMVSSGMSNERIGEVICKSEAMVKVHLRALMRKLGTKRRWEAVAAGLERGLL